MLILNFAFVKTVFRKADFDASKGRSWQEELFRLKLNPITTEFTSCLTYAWVEDTEPAEGAPSVLSVDANPHTAKMVQLLVDGGKAAVVKAAPKYGDDTAPWFTLQVGIDHGQRHRASFTDVDYKRYDGCPVAISLAAMAFRADLKRVIKACAKEIIRL